MAISCIPCICMYIYNAELNIKKKYPDVQLTLAIAVYDHNYIIHTL